jgi:glycosyltransferase involved in cell wall biosynthesis
VIRYCIPLWNGKRDTKAIIHEVKGLPIRELSFNYTINAISHYRHITSVIEAEKIDVVVFSNILAGTGAVIAGRRHRVPIVFDYLDHFPESASVYYDNPIARTIVREVVSRITTWNLRSADYVVTVSRSFQGMLKEWGAKKVALIPNGVDLDLFRHVEKHEALDKLGVRDLDEKLVVTYVGSRENWVDLEVVSGAIDKLNEINIPTVFLIVGSSIAGGHYRNFGFGSGIMQTGLVPHELVPLYLSASDVCVLPLRRMVKNLTRPLKLYEYFACGKPVLSLPNSEIESEFGDAVTFFRDSRELAQIILAFQRKPEEYSSKIRRGMCYAKENSWERLARDYERLLTKIIK